MQCPGWLLDICTVIVSLSIPGRLVDKDGADEHLADYFTPKVKFQSGTCNDAGNGNVK